MKSPLAIVGLDFGLMVLVAWAIPGGTPTPVPAPTVEADQSTAAPLDPFAQAHIADQRQASQQGPANILLTDRMTRLDAELKRLRSVAQQQAQENTALKGWLVEERSKLAERERTIDERTKGEARATQRAVRAEAKAFEAQRQLKEMAAQDQQDAMTGRRSITHGVVPAAHHAVQGQGASYVNGGRTVRSTQAIGEYIQMKRATGRYQIRATEQGAWELDDQMDRSLHPLAVYHNGRVHYLIHAESLGLLWSEFESDLDDIESVQTVLGDGNGHSQSGVTASCFTVDPRICYVSAPAAFAPRDALPVGRATQGLSIWSASSDGSQQRARVLDNASKRMEDQCIRGTVSESDGETMTLKVGDYLVEQTPGTGRLKVRGLVVWADDNRFAAVPLARLLTADSGRLSIPLNYDGQNGYQSRTIRMIPGLKAWQAELADRRELITHRCGHP